MRPPIDSFAVSKLGGTVECVMGGRREEREQTEGQQRPGRWKQHYSRYCGGGGAVKEPG